VTVTLVPQTPTPLAQGLPFTFTAQVQNSGPGTATVTVTERLEPVGGGSPVDFVANNVSVPAGGTKSINSKIGTAQYFSQTGSFTITPMISGVPAGSAITIDITAPTVLPPTFQDVTASAGLTLDPLPTPSCDGRLSAGAAWADVNKDGKLDLYVPLPDQNAKLFIFDGTLQAPHFTDMAAQYGVLNAGSVGRAAVFADYNNDGNQDLYVLNEGPNRLYRNNGNNTFTDVTTAAGVGDPGWSHSGAWGDYDKDGYLDLYVVNYAYCAWNYQNDTLYHNNGNGTFTDVTSYLEHGPGCADGCTIGSGFQAAWFDYDKDGDLDLYLANDYNAWGPNPDANHLWRNDGTDGVGGWIFTDVTASANAAPADLQSMGIGISDSDGDLDLDLAISDINGNQGLRNNNNGTFTWNGVADAVNFDRPWESANVYQITWGLAYYDFNLDTSEDLYVAAGAILVPGEGSTDPRHNQMFVNLGDGHFADLSTLSGADTGLHSRGVAFADYDRDGKMDMFVVNQAAAPILYHNTTATSNHWLEVDPVGKTGLSNKDGCGAVMLLTIGTKRILRQAFCGSVSLGTGNDPYVHFGLGTATIVNKLLIVWPDGKRQVQTNLAVDQAIKISEP